MGCGASSGEKAPAAGSPQKKAITPGDEKKEAKEVNMQYQEKMEFLAKMPLMKRLPKDQHPIVASICIPQDFKKGDKIIKQGDAGNEFFVIRTGVATVHQSIDGAPPKRVATLKVGDYFGENALLRDEPRTATIIADCDMTTLKIKRENFQEEKLNEKLQFANRRAVGAGGIALQKAKPPSLKTKDEVKLISDALRRNENLATMTALDDTKVAAFVAVMWKEELKKGQEVITEGDLQADYFYVVQSGTFEICIMDAEGDEAPNSAEKALSNGDSRVVSVVSAGESFGELALLYFVPRAATVKAKQDAVVWVIDRGNFKDILMKVSETKQLEYVKYLDGVKSLDALLSGEKTELAKALVEMHFTKDELIVQQGEPGNTFYVMYDGKVDIIIDGKIVTSMEADMKRSSTQYFGEKALLENDNRAATVMVTSEAAKCLVLDRDSFDLLLTPLKDIIPSSDRKAKISVVGQIEQMAEGRDKIMREDLYKIGLLGCGGFGAVELFEHKVTFETYALKRLSKGYILKTGMQDSVMNEKNILMMTNSPFIIKLYETYNGLQSLYFLLEPALGGELYATYNRKGFHGSEKHCKYYIAGTMFAFEHLHLRRIIYRDLKPENLLLTERGHIKLTDMGLAKFVIGKTYTTCGTPDYFAPELIASTGHTNAVDWWTLGILIFELMVGHPPFESAYPMQIYAKVTKGIGKVHFPSNCQGPVADLIKGLLKNEPSERLPMRPGGMSNLKNHKWYQGFDFDGMKALTLTAPYRPVVKSNKDLANFSARKEDMPRQLDYVDPGTGWDKYFASV